MRPAYSIPLTDDQFALLGRLTAYLGMAEDSMTNAVAHLLNVGRSTANAIMGSTKIADNCRIWGSVIAERCQDEETLWLVKHAQAESQAVSEMRNDFIHSVFSTPTFLAGGAFVSGIPEGVMVPTGAGGFVIGPPAFARRVKSDKTRTLRDLPVAVDRAARLSCLIPHITEMIANPGMPSAWHERLAPTLPPRPQKEEARSAKEPRARQKPSPE